MAFSRVEARDQSAALSVMARLVAKGLEDPRSAPAIIRAARAIVSDCESKDDQCEAQAIYDAVKNGTDKAPALRRGLRYVSDPRTYDHFQSAARTLKECATGSCAEDCDGHSILVASLCLALGFKAGLRAWGPQPGKRIFEHVYPIVALPKHGPWPKGYTGHGMDTTVTEAYVGWEPPRGAVLTVWIDGG